MKIVTWNVNSIRARHDRLVKWLETFDPDILCIQELKVEDHKLPREGIEALGFHVEAHGQKTWNGVAILSKQPPTQVTRGFDDGVDDPQARFITATFDKLTVMTAYVPNGQTVTSDKYAYKLEWLERLRRCLAARLEETRNVLLCGDINIVPTDLDIHDPKSFEGDVPCTPAEREALQAVVDLGFTDVVRHLTPDDPAYTWWDYRALGFPMNKGMRIDHIYVTEGLVDAVLGAGVDRDARKGKKPSDHAPVWVEVEG